MLSDNLVAYWSLENVNDSKGANTLTNNGSATFAAGKVANAVSLNGTTQYLSIADNAALSMGDIDFTVACWVNLTSKAAAAEMISKYATTGNQREYRLIYQSANDRFRFDVAPSGTTTGTLTVSADNLGSPSTATWYFVVAYHDSVNNVIGISVNAGTPNTAAYSAGVFDGTSQLRLGQNSTSGNFVNGLLDEVAIWKRVLSAAERTDLYNGGSGRDYAYISGAGGAITGTAAITLGAATLAATGELAIAATASTTLATLTLAATGSLAIGGQLTATLDALTLAATGAGEAAGNSGAAAIQLGEMTLSSTGVLASGPISATAAIMLGDLAITSLATLVIIGAATIQLGALSLVASERAPVIELAYGFVYGAASDGVVVGAMAQGSVYGASDTGEVFNVGSLLAST